MIFSKESGNFIRLLKSLEAYFFPAMKLNGDRELVVGLELGRKESYLNKQQTGGIVWSIALLIHSIDLNTAYLS